MKFAVGFASKRVGTWRTPVCRLCGRYLALLGRPIRVTVPAVTVAPTALVGSLISRPTYHTVCRGVYIGESMRPVRLRYNEHRRDAINKTANTPLGDHFGKEHIQDQSHQDHHTNQNILDLKVLYRALDHPDRKIAESIYIRRRAPALNIQGSSWPIMRVVWCPSCLARRTDG